MYNIRCIQDPCPDALPPMVEDPQFVTTPSDNTYVNNGPVKPSGGVIRNTSGNVITSDGSLNIPGVTPPQKKEEERYILPVVLGLVGTYAAIQFLT